MTSSRTESLHDAAFRGDVPEIHRHVIQGADLNSPGPDGYPPLLNAATQGHHAAVQAFVSLGADIEAADRWSGRTALIEAARRGHLDVVQSLVQAGAHVDHADHGRVTPLVHAVRAEHWRIVTFLVATGADVDTKTSDGATLFEQWAVTPAVNVTSEFWPTGAAFFSIGRRPDLELLSTAIRDGLATRLP